ncbi:MAG: ice-binding family protein [Chloroflexota bacterium]|nr:ice-binding family protein [Chloroflexota bacterium]
MKNSRAFIAIVGIAFVIAIGAMAGRTANAATATVPLGTAATFSVLAGTPSITNTGPTTIDREVGIHPAAAVTGFPPGIAAGGIHAGDAVALQAKSDLVTAYDNAAGRTPFTSLSGDLGLQPPLVGGVYRGGALGLTGTLTLDGANDPSSVWIFQAASSLTTASSSSVSFIRGGSPCNVFWQIGSSASLGTGSSIVGTIMAMQSITLADSVTVQGRALARNGTVTLINDRFLTSQCNAPTVLTPPTRPPFTVAPSATPAATPTVAASPTTPAPAATPIVGAVKTAAPTTRTVAGAQTLPSTSTDPLGPLAMLGMALTGIGVLLLVRRPIRHL